MDGPHSFDTGPLALSFFCNLAYEEEKKTTENSKQLVGIFHTMRGTYVDSVDIDVGDDPVFPLHVFSVDGKRQVLGHDSVLFNNFHARRLEVLCEQAQGVVVVEFGTVQEPTSPCEDGGDRVRARLIALLVLAVVPGNSACNEKDLAPATCSVCVVKRRTMCGFALNDQPIRRQQLARHHPETSKALREDVALYISVVVLGRPYEFTRGLDGLCDHVVDESMLVVNVEGLELGLVLAIQDPQGQEIAHIF